MVQLKFAVVLFSILHLSCGIGLPAGPVGFYDFIELKSCNCPNDCKGSSNLFIAKDGDVKSVDGNFTLPYDADSSFNVKFSVDRWTGSQWQTNFLKIEGSLCKNVKKVAPNIYTNFMKKLTPKVSEKECQIPKGSYTFKNLQNKASDVKLPSLMYSKYRAKAIIYKDKDEVMCIETTIMVSH